MREPHVDRVVLDTVIFISAFLSETGLASALLWLYGERLSFYTSEEILEEVRNGLLQKAHIRRRFRYPDEDVESFLSEVREICEIVSLVPQIRVIERDPKDDKILACAIAAKAKYLITRDLDLLDLGEYGRIQILTPEDFMRILREQERQEPNE